MTKGSIEHLVVLRGRRLIWFWGMQEKLEEQLQPLFALLEEIQGRLARGGKIPSFGTLKDWALVCRLLWLSLDTQHEF